ncbi:Poly-beta-hydroxybutyrate polymerase [Aquicella siphonis]|uniref:Poly-beta-hydroxybutyrate polymerase n=1 Tax=Aquicella siphonis TaxID=254247 RepID=A0A5E4PIR7_9COXI|nr:alpha/beta fold hydrolase [Aquicella siphonis]VVC76959.1 Poly-beta-hydroxybutyrate polymerase [Aquicella siphonis]
MLDAHWEEKHEKAEAVDRSLQVAVSKFTGGISPAALMIAFFDWYFHLLIHPAKQMELYQLYQDNLLHLFNQFMGHLSGDASGEYCIITSPQDKRFTGKRWQEFPYSFYYESFLLVQNWWHVAASKVRGVSRHHEDVVDFTLRQILDMLSPANSVLTNPEIQQAAIEQNGENFLKGLENFLEDIERNLANKPPVGSENFVIGDNIAATPGKVIYRNQLIELIQYSPVTDKVYAEPVLITPAWIMKYYILDLTPKHSLVNYLVKKGHTVFMISWKNPKRKDRNLGMEEYLNLGIMSALDVISCILPRQKIHLVGYCLGGTLASIAAATLARDNDNRLASMTLFAAQTDFTEPGELGLFIDESQITFLESIMQEKGYLDTHQMAGAFQLLRSNDLIWSRLIHDYMLGVRKPLTDLMSWNADATRMPYKMHSEYLRRLFLHNELAEGKFIVANKPIALTDISIPIFVVATERDHVSPWHSVFKINLLTNSDVTFALTSGGHNVGIVSLPSKTTKRHYRISTLKENDRFIDADSWYQNSKVYEGSWWPAFEKWLAKKSGKKIAPPEMGCEKEGYLPLEDAPGSYVLQK